MPNNTYCEVIIQGLNPEITLVANRLNTLEADPHDRDGFLKSFLNDPGEDAQGRVKKDANNIRSLEWGTKWDVYGVRSVSFTEIPEDQKNHFTYDGEVECIWESAWSPPIEGLIKLSKKHKLTIQIKYEDEGMAFVGMYKVIEGEPVFDHCFERDRIIEGLYQVFGIDRLREYFKYHFENNHNSAFTLLTNQKHWMSNDIMLDLINDFLIKLKPKDIRPLILD